jgi:hypothetical protein
MVNMTNVPTATAESFWAALQALTEMQAETDRQMKETDRQMKETDRQMKETDRQMKETDRKIDKVNATIGSWSYNQGRFAEEYFFNSFEHGKQNFFGEKFDEIKKNLKKCFWYRKKMYFCSEFIFKES